MHSFPELDLYAAHLADEEDDDDEAAVSTSSLLGKRRRANSVEGLVWARFRVLVVRPEDVSRIAAST